MPPDASAETSIWNDQSVPRISLFSTERPVDRVTGYPYSIAMSTQTGIEWTDATWNPVSGCAKVSPGCDNCYAERFAERFRGVAGHPFGHGFDMTLRTH